MKRRLSVLLRCARPWQSSIASLIGFAGVIITLLMHYNFERSIYTRNRADEAKAIRFALAVELIAIHTLSEFNNYADSSGRNSELSYKVWVIPQDAIYLSILNKINLLEKEEIVSVQSAYILQSISLRMIKYLSDDHSINNNPNISNIRPEHASHFLALMARLHKAAGRAVEVLCIREPDACANTTINRLGHNPP